MKNRTEEIKRLVNAPESVKDEYWRNRALEMESILQGNSEDVDSFQRSLYEILKLAIEHEQYKFPRNTFEEVERVVKFKVNLQRGLIESLYNVKTYSLYGVGLYAPIKGLLLPRYYRKQTHYDTFSCKGVHYDISCVPEEIRDDYNFNLAVPAMGGLFVPRRTRFTDEIGYRTRLQYLDITEG